jgi:hypothetical protein
MAPEVILNHHHDLTSDFFAIGVMTYEFMFGKVNHFEISYLEAIFG